MLRVRFAEPTDTGSLEEFYRSNPSPFVETRQPGLIAERVAGRSALILTGARPESIVGATLTYPLAGGRHVEFGSTRTAGVRGFPLYEILLSLQALAALHAPFPELWPVADVDVDNPSVIRRLTTRLGFEQSTPPSDLVAENMRSIVARRTDVVWLRCPAWSLGVHAALIIELTRIGQITDLRGRSRPFEIDSSLAAITAPRLLGAIRRASEELRIAGIASWSHLRQRVLQRP